MDHTDSLLALFLHFLLLSLIAIGGVTAVLPDIHRYVVDSQHWMTPRQFADAFALGQVSPGPNVMYVTLLGWRIAGLRGAIATTVAMVLPPATLTLLVARLKALAPGAPLGRAIRGGLAPITLGLMLASGWILVRSANYHWPGYLLIALTMAVVMRTNWNPLWLIAAGAIAGIAGVV